VIRRDTEAEKVIKVIKVCQVYRDFLDHLVVTVRLEKEDHR